MMDYYCRLCAELKDPTEILASIADVEQSMEQKLMACCQWTTENSEQRLPHSVCGICLDKLDKCWLFSQSVQFAQQKLIEIFENEAEIDLETKPLATAMVQTVYDFPDYSIESPSPQVDTKASSCPKQKKKVKKIKKSNPPKSNRTEANGLDEAVHKCPECGRSFQRRWNLTDHMQIHSEERPYGCWQCDKKFKTFRSLRAHYKVQSGNKCEICLRLFCMASELKAHKKSPCEPPSDNQCNSMMQSNAIPIKFELNEPATDFNRDERCIGNESSSKIENRNIQRFPWLGINGPMLKRKKEQKGPFECEQCGRIFLKKCNLSAHRSVHSGVRPYECFLCHKVVRLRKNLKEHLKIHTICSKIRMDIKKAKEMAKLFETGDGGPIDINCLKHKCDECGKFFTRKTTLREHQAAHSNEPPTMLVECWLCHKTLKSIKSLKSHIKLHLYQRIPSAPAELNWICELCGKAFTARYTLNNHMQSKHSDERPYKCDSCGLGFKTSRLLRLHSRTHSDRQYDCNQCEKSFRSILSLKRHLEFHTGVIKRPHLCDLCGKGFRLKFNLVEHRRIHTGEKPHSCEYCSTKFRTNSSYCSHMKKIHGISVSARNREEQESAQTI